jgi:hypothetical protein
MKWLLALLPLAAAAPALPTIELGDAPPPGSVCLLSLDFMKTTTYTIQVTIRGVSYGGTGCPQGTVSSQISSDRTIMTLIFDSYIASIGPGISVTEQRKNCQLNVDIAYPGGFQYSILSADYRGYSSIQKGVSGTLKSTYYFSGQTAQVRSSPSSYS